MHKIKFHPNIHFQFQKYRPLCNKIQHSGRKAYNKESAQLNQLLKNLLCNVMGLINLTILHIYLILKYMKIRHSYKKYLQLN